MPWEAVHSDQMTPEDRKNVEQTLQLPILEVTVRMFCGAAPRLQVEAKRPSHAASASDDAAIDGQRAAEVANEAVQVASDLLLFRTGSLPPLDLHHPMLGPEGPDVEFRIRMIDYSANDCEIQVCSANNATLRKALLGGASLQTFLLPLLQVGAEDAQSGKWRDQINHSLAHS